MSVSPETFWSIAKEFARNGMQISDCCAAMGLHMNSARSMWRNIWQSGIATMQEIEDVKYQFFRNRQNNANRRYYGSKPRPKSIKEQPPEPKPVTPDDLWRRAMEGKRFDEIKIKPQPLTRFNAVTPPAKIGGGSILGTIAQGE